MVFQQGDGAVLAHHLLEGDFHFPAGRVGGVDYPAMAVAAFTGKMKFVFRGVIPQAETDAAIDQPLNRAGRVAHHELDGFSVTQSAAGIDGVVDVGAKRIVFAEYRGDSALGVAGRAFAQFGLRQDGDADTPVGQPQRQRQAGQPAADDHYWS